MKLRYYLSGLGSGIIIAVLIMLIADKVIAVNNNVNGSNVPQETTGSVIAYTTQSDKHNETIQADQIILVSLCVIIIIYIASCYYSCDILI